MEVKTSRRTQLVDITREVESFIRKSGISSGVLLIFVPHTTCGVLINENYDPSVAQDIENTLTKIAPHNASWKHTEGNADSHVKTAIVGNSVLLPFENSKLILGTWQGIFLAEFDGPRTRSVILKIIEL